MATDLSSLETGIKRWTLLLGVAQVTLGCIVGFIPPTAVEWFRGIVMSHIEFTANGVLMIAFGFLVPEMRLGIARSESVVRDTAAGNVDKWHRWPCRCPYRLLLQADADSQ